jgi:flagellar biogenesis protein FliO
MSETDALRVVLALAAVVAVLAGALWAVRRLPALGGRLAGQPGRVAALETRWLDPRTRLVLVGWDGNEHLVLIGPNGAHVIASRGPAAVGGSP